MRIKTNYRVSKYFLGIFILSMFILSISPVSHFILNYILEEISFDFLDFIITSLAFLTALYFFFANQRDSHNKKIEEQINLIEGLCSEINFIEGNINWYKQEISNNTFSKLDHLINRIYIENYLGRLKGKFFIKEGFSVVSNINDKIFQLNTRVSEGRAYIGFAEKNIPPDKKFNQQYCLSILSEVLVKIDDLKTNLDKQKDLAEKDLIG